MPIGAAVALAGLAYGVYNSEKQKKLAKEGLAKQKFTNYGVSPELQAAYARAQDMARYGFTPTEKAVFRQNTAQNINTQAQRALDVGGGNLARTISKLGQISNLQAQNQFAGQDAALHRQNIHYADTLARALQSQKNMATGADIQQFNRANQAFGNAYAQNQTNENQLISQLPYLAAQFGGASYGPTGSPYQNSFRAGTQQQFPLEQYGSLVPNQLSFRSNPSDDYLNSYQRAKFYTSFPQ